jgi:hypothetical protein
MVEMRNKWIVMPCLKLVSDDDTEVLMIEILNGKACSITGGRGTCHCWVSVAECNEGHSFFEVLIIY